MSIAPVLDYLTRWAYMVRPALQRVSVSAMDRSIAGIYPASRREFPTPGP